MATLTLDKVHSDVIFQIKHMMVSKAKGAFTDFDVEFTGDPDDLASASVKAAIKTASIDTGNADRDGHLKSGDFFEAEKYPEITFASKSIKKVSDDKFEVTGDFTIKDVTKTETFHVTYNGTAKNPMDGSMVAGFDVEGRVNREDYGLTWNAALETGGVLVGKEVKFTGNFEFAIKE
ncbi:YceI family protein [Metabacillus sp. GX 13764]|uniref:YceI family protein n=1 Tax=Metabacillus kandeliae TaxID=2900151 RepID=UPI001E3DB582|nr:YceI family protein [Metabacillus kandeliae]MCD7035851.1 YceI family protein [Metabacillus kandeliae]